MSSHYVWVQCPEPGCGASEGIYTGDTVLDHFEGDQWEGHVITVPCDEHLGGESNE